MNTENKNQKSEIKAAIFYITDNGLAIAKRLNELYPDAQVLRFDTKTVSMIWQEYKTLIFIMAAGIVVRTIAPLIKDKKTDPAVIVLDEKGQFAVSLLSGHLGGANEKARGIAHFLGGEAVITTASDINNLPAIDLWAQGNDLIIEDRELVPQIGTRLVNNGALRIYTQTDIALPDEFLKVAEPRFADVLITNKKEIELDVIPISPSPSSPPTAFQLYLRPKNLVIGIGCNSGTSSNEIEDAVKETLAKHNLSFLSIRSISTIDKKGSEAGLVEFAEKYGLEIQTFTANELNTVKGLTRSEAAFKATGANSVAEPAAILASGNDTLIVSKQRIGNVTVAAAELKTQNSKLYIVGTGPGSIEHITPYAQRAIRESDVIVGYGTYLDLIPELLEGKEVVSTGMTQEVDRCKKAVELAMTGKTVSVISGGDPGIYAMAGLVFETIKGQESGVTSHELSVEVVPGISALNACASRLGAPLMHDFASISLSDRLTPWEMIEKRLEAAAMADFVIALYNPKSKGRAEHINKAQEIILRHRHPETPVGIVKAAMREDERIIITDLKNMLHHEIDMQTTLIIGNSQTFTWENRMITPRGYERKLKI